jgi:radical SAM protein with 4Fe4S-binding SPASM domain
LHASIDGASQQTYQQYRVGGDFELAVHNLRMLAKAKSRLDASTELAWKFVVFKANEQEIPQAVEMAGQIGVPIIFQLMSTDGDASWNSSLHDRAVGMDDGDPLVVTVNGKDHQVVWRNYVPMARARAREAGGGGARAVPTTPPKRDYPMPANRVGLDPALPWCCAHPFEALYVNSDGNVSPCCTAYGDAMMLGNLLEQTLEEVWNVPEMTRCRQYLLEYGSEEETGAVCETRPCLMKAMATGKP